MSLPEKEQSTALMKHIDRKIHHVEELLYQKGLLLNNILTNHQPADMLTKSNNYN